MDNILISSTEELSPEDRLLLASSKRQEPQGEEHTGSSSSDVKSKDGSMSSGGGGVGSLSLQRTKSKIQPLSSDSDSSDDEDEDDGMIYQNVGGYQSVNSNSLSSRSSHHRNSGGHPCNMSLDSNSHSTYNTLIIHHNNNSLLADTWIPASHEFTSLATGSNRNSTSSNPRKSQSPTKDGMGYKHGQSGSGYDSLLTTDSGSATNELSDIPRDCLDQLTVLKHLAKEVQQDPISSPPNSKLLRSASFSRSQPDLSQSTPMTALPTSSSHDYSYYYDPPPQQAPYYQQAYAQRKKQQQQANEDNDGSQCVPSTSVQMLEILMRENSNLRAELANARMKIQTIHKLEAELTRLQKQHASLFESAERRESLERTARAKLSTEVKRLTAVNRELMSSSNSLQNLSSYSLGSDMDSYKKELARKDQKISQLISQNKDLAAIKERQDIELAAQRATLEEQRTHIDILDSALTTAQGNVVRLEEECRRNQEYAEKVSQLQRALSSLQLSNEKREQSEKKLRSQLESEITDLKLQLASKNANSNLTNNRVNVHAPVQHNSTSNANNNSRNYNAPPPYPGSGNVQQSVPTNQQHHQSQHQQSNDIAPELQILQEKLRLSEEKIQSLTSVVQRWENFFTMDSQNDKTPVTSVSTPNTPNSWSSRGGTPHFFGNGGSGSSSTAALDDLPSTQNRATDLEWKVKELESRLMEKDNMLRTLSYQNSQQQKMEMQQQQQMSQHLYSPYSSSSSYLPSGYSRESPNYSVAHQGIHHPVPLNLHNHQNPQINHQVSVSLASMMDSGRRYGIDPMMFYEKVGKCESEPPSYANLPPKLRLGGSGSSLAKNSNESLGSAGLSSGNGGTSNNTSEPESGSSDGSKAKSIDEQLKELNTQLLSKGAVGLKMQSGLCCIPGFSNPSAAARKGKIPQPLLESMNMNPRSISPGSCNMAASSNAIGMTSNNNPPYKKHVLPPLPRPPSQGSQQNQNQQQQSVRTSSGPPFISPSGSSSALCSASGGASAGIPLLSTSVDSMLAESANGKNALPPGTGGGNVFTPVSNLPKGLPPRSPGIAESSKCRSLERDQRSKSSNDSGVMGKFTSLGYDTSRCKSLDRRELKAQNKEAEKEEKEKEKKLQKSAVGSKAAFFGGLLSRKSPSPSRKAKDKTEEKEKAPASQSQKSVRFPFSRSSAQIQGQNGGGASGSSGTHHENPSASDQEMDTEFLDLQGRSSQRSRISKWTSSTSNLESLQEHPGSGNDSPWVQRRSGGEPSSRKQSTEPARSIGKIATDESNNVGDEKKWGKIVKSPFGLRYTFGSPKS